MDLAFGFLDIPFFTIAAKSGLGLTISQTHKVKGFLIVSYQSGLHGHSWHNCMLLMDKRFGISEGSKDVVHIMIG